MKKIIPLLLALTLLAACGSSSENATNLFDTLETRGGVDIVRDVQTGCIYYYYTAGYQAALSPYYDEDGQVAGCGEEQLNKEKYSLE